MAGRRPQPPPQAHFDQPPPHLPRSRPAHNITTLRLAHSIGALRCTDPPNSEETSPRKQNYHGGLKLQPQTSLVEAIEECGASRNDAD